MRGMNKRVFSNKNALLCYVYIVPILSSKSTLSQVHDITDRDITGLSYEEQLDYKRQVLQKRENELKNYTVKEKEKTDKIINKIKE